MKQIRIQKSFTNLETRSLELFLQDIDKIPLLTQQEEVDLAKRIKSGDKLALYKLVTSNLRFAVSISKQYQHNGLSLNDLISEASIGLMEAALRFDESKGFKFISYAVWWIRQSINQALNDKTRMIRIPSHKNQLFSRIRNIQSSFEQTNHRLGQADEVYDVIKQNPTSREITLDMVKEMMESNHHMISLDQPVSVYHDFEACLVDVIKNEDGNTVIDNIDLESNQRQVTYLLSKLTKQERMVVEQYFGIGTQPQTLENIGPALKVTRERVRQIKEGALKKLRSLAKSSLV